MSPTLAGFLFHEAVSDLLGICPTMYAAERDELKAIGLALTQAAARARRGRPTSLGGRAAYRRATEATARVCTVVSGDVERVGRAAAARVRRA